MRRWLLTFGVRAGSAQRTACEQPSILERSAVMVGCTPPSARQPVRLQDQRSKPRYKAGSSATHFGLQVSRFTESLDQPQLGFNPVDVFLF